MRKLILATALAAVAMPAAPVLAARTATGYTVYTTRMKAGPDYDYPTVRRIRRDARVSVYGCLSDRSWCDAGYRYDRGWIEGRDLAIVDRGRRLGISSYMGIGVLTFVFGSYWEDHYRSQPFYHERPRWERRYYDNYKPHWGPRPSTPPSYHLPDRQRAAQARPGPDRHDAKPPHAQDRMTSPAIHEHEKIKAKEAPAPRHEQVRMAKDSAPQREKVREQQDRASRHEQARVPQGSAPQHEKAREQQGPAQQQHGNQKERGKPQSDNKDKKHDRQ